MIRKTSYHSGTASIYPGIYQPPFTKEQDLIKIKSSRPPVNIIEFPDCYEIEMPAPGFNKDDFLIKSQGCSLIIAVRKKVNDRPEKAQYRQHGFNYRHIARSVDLPADADTEFGTAEYKNGVLSIYLYKTSFPVQNHQNFIIVY
ncbi:MAG TPA: Hsp20/alpha crystallin family protein [Niastella sp.]